MQTPKRSLGRMRLRNVVCIGFSTAAAIAALELTGSTQAIQGPGSTAVQDDMAMSIGSFVGGAAPRSTPSCNSPCSQPVAMVANFDDVTAPVLPAGWLATNALGPEPHCVTSNDGAPLPSADT